jgi:hypothetical protein
MHGLSTRFQSLSQPPSTTQKTMYYQGLWSLGQHILPSEWASRLTTHWFSKYPWWGTGKQKANHGGEGCDPSSKQCGSDQVSQTSRASAPSIVTWALEMPIWSQDCCKNKQWFGAVRTQQTPIKWDPEMSYFTVWSQSKDDFLSFHLFQRVTAAFRCLSLQSLATKCSQREAEAAFRPCGF